MLVPMRPRFGTVLRGSGIPFEFHAWATSWTSSGRELDEQFRTANSQVTTCLSINNTYWEQLLLSMNIKQKLVKRGTDYPKVSS
jgi:hypothetical protein